MGARAKKERDASRRDDRRANPGLPFVTRTPIQRTGWATRTPPARAKVVAADPKSMTPIMVLGLAWGMELGHALDRRRQLIGTRTDRTKITVEVGARLGRNHLGNIPT